MARLTKQTREDICDSVLKSTNFDDRFLALNKEIAQWGRSEMLKRLPPDFTMLTDPLPSDWFRHIIHVTSPWQHQAVRVDFEPIRVPVFFDEYIKSEQCQPWKDKLDALKDEKQQVYIETMGFLKSCFTTEKMVERMPEFERHIPKSAGITFPVVAGTANLASLLFRTGFDKGLKEAA